MGNEEESLRIQRFEGSRLFLWYLLLFLFFLPNVAILKNVQAVEINFTQPASPYINVRNIFWETLTTTNDTGRAFVGLGSWDTATVQVTGTFGASGNLAIQVSNDTGASPTWTTIANVASAGITTINSGYWQTRVKVTAGDGNTDLDVTLVATKSQEDAKNLDDLLDVTITNPTDNQSLTYDTTTGKWINETVAGGGGGTPGGSNTQVQFNDSSAFGGDAGFVYNKTTDTATLTNLNVTDDITLDNASFIKFKDSGGTPTSTLTLSPGNDTVFRGAVSGHVYIQSANDIYFGTPSAVYLSLDAAGVLTHTGTLNISNTAPYITLTDTTASAKSLKVKVDSNKAYLQELAGVDGSLLTLDLTNNVIEVGDGTVSTNVVIRGAIGTLAMLRLIEGTANAGFEVQCEGSTNTFIILSDNNGGLRNNRLVIERDSGNIGFNTSAFGTSAAKVLAIGNGTAPTTSPADMFQMWSADRNAIDGKAGLHLRTEDGTSHVFSDLSGIGILTPTAILHLKAGTATANTAPLKFTAGTNLTTPEAGAMEFSGADLFITDSTPTRHGIISHITDASDPHGATLTQTIISLTNYQDIAQISVPANPGAGTRRLFVDSADGKLKVRTSAGTSVSLEEAGTGSPGGADTNIQFNSSGAFGGSANFVWDGAEKINVPNILTTSTDALVLENTTDSDATNKVQMSPRLRLHGEVWLTGGTPANQTSDWIIENMPVSGNPTGSALIISHDTNAGGYVQCLNIDTKKDNVALGRYALDSNTTGTYAIAIGYNALTANTSGMDIIAIGRETLLANTTGYDCLAIGSKALYSNTTGTDNVALGHEALTTAITSSHNTAIGSYALNRTTASYNVAVGRDAGYYNITGGGNCIIGYRANYGVNGQSHSNNCVFGYAAGYALTTGSNQILIGYQAGDNLTSGGTNIIIGFAIDAPSATASNQMSIGNIIFATGVDGTGTTISSGGVSLGATSPAATAILDLTSTTKGFLAPRMTTTQRDAITTPATGLIIYNTTTNKLNFYNSAAWEAVTSL